MTTHTKHKPLTKELKEALDGGFKLKFGNARHIDIVKDLDNLGKEYRELDRKKKAIVLARGKTALEKRIEVKEKSIARSIIAETGDN